MDFCEKCGKLLMGAKKITNETKIYMECLGCKHRNLAKDSSEFEIEEKIEHNYKIEDIKSEVIDERIADTTKPTRVMYCSNCAKKTKIAFWQRQTRSADESPTRFFQCTECAHTWREYD